MEQSISEFWGRCDRGDRLPYLTKFLSELLPADGRIYQILFLSIFLGLGVIARDWSLSWSRVGITLFACGFFQVLFMLIDRRFNSKANTPHLTFSTPLSALVTGLSLCLLLRTNSDLTMIFAAMMAIASKFIFRFNQKHWFNPANFGIVSALLFGSAWISPGQWGHDLWLVLIFAGLGFAVLGKVGRWDTSLAFFASYAALEGIRNLYLGWTMDVLLHRLSSGSLLLFALFMITDPRSTPNARLGRIFWAILVGIVSFIFQNYLFISAAPFWALFVCAPLSVICDRLFVDSRFNWLPKKPNSQLFLIHGS
jgi:Na+-transporting NADH:ubiquinone oxidoreductase subunit NqrB